ncbi:hypothetical protein RF11_06079 [Thelohanellus kitauei]|uniref:Uncharacterized protein n=1 Tax=Thelohanellus kitauei TaxID=669202 RepID=A0A0C2MG24_THEKT|nr:hypothetical protein RF11_06079 [Thelohanellus kitauei]
MYTLRVLSPKHRVSDQDRHIPDHVRHFHDPDGKSGDVISIELPSVKLNTVFSDLRDAVCIMFFHTENKFFIRVEERRVGLKVYYRVAILLKHCLDPIFLASSCYHL